MLVSDAGPGVRMVTPLVPTDSTHVLSNMANIFLHVANLSARITTRVTYVLLFMYFNVNFLSQMES